MTAPYVPPYVSVGELVKFINSLRSRKPEWLTLKALQDIGISKSNSYTLKGSLVRMGIYDEEEGKLLQREDLIGLSSKDESIKRETFKRILERTYPDLLEQIPIEEATVEKVRNYFEKKEAKPGPAMKGARLFIWLADQAGFETAEDEFTPYNLEQEKAPKQKDGKKKSRTDGSSKRKIDEAGTSYPKTAGDYEERLLNILLDKISSTDTLPSSEILQQVRELIEAQKQKNKSHHAGNPTELSASRENSGA
jgi:hypothetical protein